MSRGINKVILIGNCGADPEVRYSAQGSAITTVSLATNDRWRDKQSGEIQERTEWHRIVLFTRLAEVARDYLRKGSKVYIEGRLQTRKWQGDDGRDRYTTEVVANNMQMLDSRGGAPPEGGYPRDGEAPGQRPGPNKDDESGAGPNKDDAPGPDPNKDDFEDDIPF